MMEPDLDHEISQWKMKLKQIQGEYFTSMTKDWPTIKNKEFSVIREIEKLKKIQRDNMLAGNHDAIPKRKNNHHRKY